MLAGASPLRVSRTSRAGTLLGRRLRRAAAAARPGPLWFAETRALPQSRAAAGPPACLARRVQPLHEQGSRDPLAGLPAERAAAKARAGQTPQVPQPA